MLGAVLHHLTLANEVEKGHAEVRGGIVADIEQIIERVLRSCHKFHKKIFRVEHYGCDCHNNMFCVFKLLSM